MKPSSFNTQIERLEALGFGEAVRREFDVERDHNGHIIRYRNSYECVCGEMWEDTSSSMQNDHCPKCDAEIEPYDTDNIPLPVWAELEVRTEGDDLTACRVVEDWRVTEGEEPPAHMETKYLMAINQDHRGYSQLEVQFAPMTNLDLVPREYEPMFWVEINRGFPCIHMAVGNGEMRATAFLTPRGVVVADDQNARPLQINDGFGSAYLFKDNLGRTDTAHKPGRFWVRFNDNDEHVEVSAEMLKKLTFDVSAHKSAPWLYVCFEGHEADVRALIAEGSTSTAPSCP